MPTDDQLNAPTWRYLRRREKHTLEELRLLFDWSLPGDRIYGLSPESSFSIVAKVEVDTEEPIYPCRPSEYREVKGEVEYHVKQDFVNAVTLRLARVREREAWRKYEEFRGALENSKREAGRKHEDFYAAWNNGDKREAEQKLEEFRAALKNSESKTLTKCLSREERESVERVWNRIVRRAGSPSGKGRHNWERVFIGLRREYPCHDKDKFTYPTGHFTTWLRTKEISHALAHGRLVKCHELLIMIVNVEHERLWKRLRTEVFKRYGRTCMRCGRTTGEMHIDHIKSWSQFPEQRYDLENLQVLCPPCHTWKEGTDIDYRPSCGDVTP